MKDASFHLLTMGERVSFPSGKIKVDNLHENTFAMQVQQLPAAAFAIEFA